MSNNPLRLQYLFEKYATGTASSTELEEFWSLVYHIDEHDTMPEAMNEWWNKNEGEFDLSQGVDGQKILKRVLQNDQAKEPDYLKIIDRRKIFRLRSWVAAAAAAVLVFIAGATLYMKEDSNKKLPVAKVNSPDFKNDVLPGVTGATLVLDDGNLVALDSSRNSVIAQQGEISVVAEDGALYYAGANKNEDAPLAYNTLITSKGQQYDVRLSDGTLVVLDAGSSLRYPVSFKGNERVVEINGQGWFEVAKNPAKPFFVKKGEQYVEVLGTHFNVNAYDDEKDMRVTLVEGSVKIKNGQMYHMLKPGQQAVLSKVNDGISIVESADLEASLAWKNGLFSFSSCDITQVMREVARWYDIEVIYEGDKPADTFTGGINRSATLTEVLRILEISKVHFRLDGRELTLLSK